ncbi:hypothetical protein BpHYR1_035074 [Brachionus plicatilis]|uniref:Uncharacterized protein n=1 Tax=Brachionus plicatilis TaxID=10195 RepID=A0A3M7SZ22_BRAPC|nr:hypothetical protein BpHYR1_035074 [Brachionus plicatilis]
MDMIWYVINLRAAFFGIFKNWIYYAFIEKTSDVFLKTRKEICDRVELIPYHIEYVKESKPFTFEFSYSSINLFKDPRRKKVFMFNLKINFDHKNPFELTFYAFSQSSSIKIKILFSNSRFKQRHKLAMQANELLFISVEI